MVDIGSKCLYLNIRIKNDVTTLLITNFWFTLVFFILIFKYWFGKGETDKLSICKNRRI